MTQYLEMHILVKWMDTILRNAHGISVQLNLLIIYIYIYPIVLSLSLSLSHISILIGM